MVKAFESLGFNSQATLDDYFVEVLDSFAPVYRPEDVYASNLAGALECVNAGITTLVDWSHINNTPDHSDAAIQGLKDAGIRAIYAHGVPTGGEWWAFSELEHPEDIRRIRDTYFSSDDGLITLALAARAPGNSNFEVAKHDWELARDLGIRISVHVGMRLTNVHVQHVKNMDDLGLLGPDTTYIHCTTFTEEAWTRVAASGGHVSIAAPIEMEMGHGIPPVQTALDHGIRPSLSVDVETQMPGDFFTQMRTVFTLQRMQALARERAGERAPRLLTVREVVEFGTIAGARANRLESKIGTLTPGKEADIILLRMDAINVLPINNAYGAVIHGMDTSNVDTVLIAGQIRKRQGRLVGVDVARINREAQQSRDYIIAKAGWPKTLLGGNLPGR